MTRELSAREARAQMIREQLFFNSDVCLQQESGKQSSSRVCGGTLCHRLYLYLYE
jgi:hypothetical protein